MVDRYQTVVHGPIDERDPPAPSSDAVNPSQSVLARIEKLEPAAAVVELPNGKKASLPWKEVWPLFKIHDDHKDYRVGEIHIEGKKLVKALQDKETDTTGQGRLIAVGDVLSVIPVDTDFGKGRRSIVSHRLVSRNPWDEVASWQDKEVKIFTVESVTDSWAWGIVSPGVRSRVAIEKLKEILPEKNWRGQQTPLQGDEVAGWFLPEKTDQDNRIVTLDYLGFLGSELSLDRLFNLSIPESSDALSVPPELPEVALSPVPRAHIQMILILDDDEELCESLESYLQNTCGVDTLASFDVQSASEHIQERAADIDLAIIDVNLRPGKSTGKDHTGIHFARELQKILPDCPIVLITGEQLNIDSEDISNASDLLINDIVIKPFGLDSLYRSLSAPGKSKRPLAEFLGHAIVQRIDTSSPLSDSDIDRALEDLKLSLSAEAAVLFSIDPITDEVAIQGLSGPKSKYHADKNKLGWSPIRDVAIRGESVYTHNAKDSAFLPKHRYLQSAYYYRSCIGVPIEIGMGSRLAYCLFVFHTDVRHFDYDSAKPLILRTAREVGHLLRIRKLDKSVRDMKPFEIIGQSYGSMAHDLRRYLSFFFLLDEAIAHLDSGDMKNTRATIEKSKSRLSKAISVVNGISAMTSGHSGEQRVFDALKEIVRITDRLKEEIRDDGISLILANKTRRTPRITMRPSQLDQLLTNLVINAAQQLKRLSREKTFRRKGQVRIDVMDKTEETGSLWLIIHVYDNGPGIHRRDFERVFDLFYTTKKDGCGMGLDICRKVAEGVCVGDNKGEVLVRQSVFLCGSCFEIRLPLTP